MCRPLQCGLPSIRFTRAEPQDELVAVESVKQQREKRLQIEIPSQEVLSTQIDNGLIEFCFPRLRAETRGAEPHDFGTAPALNLLNLLVEPYHADIIDMGIFSIKSPTLEFAVLKATNDR